MTPTKQDDALAALETLINSAYGIDIRDADEIDACAAKIKQALTSGAVGDALTGDCGGGDLSKRAALAWFNCIAVLYEDDVPGHIDTIKKALTADNAKRGE